jgi:hypothetical protein
MQDQDVFRTFALQQNTKSHKWLYLICGEAGMIKMPFIEINLKKLEADLNHRVASTRDSQYVLIQST